MIKRIVKLIKLYYRLDDEEQKEQLRLIIKGMVKDEMERSRTL